MSRSYKVVPGLIEVNIPRVPHALVIRGGGDDYLSLADIPEDQLYEIASIWTNQLIERAREIRAEREPHEQDR